MEKTVQHVTS